MCLTEEDKSFKLLAACAITIGKNVLALFTNTINIKWIRESVIELLLINHPLDCPVCDQAGECDLQDQTLVFGGDKGRYYEFKRAVKNKNFGTFVKTSMNRCIHCTKCIRFTNELGGFSSLGLLGRGNTLEIGSYVTNLFDANDELIANIVDLCPVGALTAKSTAFKARMWELEQVDSFDISDPFLSSIHVDIQTNQLVRILPRINKYLNENWLTNSARFLFKNLNKWRLESPFIKLNQKLIPVNWFDAYYYFKSYMLQLIYQNFFNSQYAFVFLILFGHQCDIITNYIAKLFTTSCGFTNSLNTRKQENIYRQLNIDFRNTYIFEETVHDLLQIETKNLLFLFNMNLRFNAPLLNLKIRRFNHKTNKCFIISFDHNYQTNLSLTNIKSTGVNFLKNLKGKNWINSYFKKRKISFLISTKWLKNTYNIQIIHWLKQFFQFLKKTKVYINIFTKNVTKLNLKENGFECGCHPLTEQAMKKGKTKFSKIIYTINKKINNQLKNKNDFHIAQGYQLVPNNNNNPDIIFASKHFFEGESAYFSIEGKLKKSPAIIISPLFNKTNWNIFHTLSLYCKITFVKTKVKKITDSFTKTKKYISTCLAKSTPFVKISKKSDKKNKNKIKNKKQRKNNISIENDLQNRIINKQKKKDLSNFINLLVQLKEKLLHNEKNYNYA